jgi:antitoxin (DNA-binding transcriptional repressor) of toxin-antitoxin stability system
VTTHEAKSNLSKLLAQVEAGEEVEIRRGDIPVARLQAVRAKGRRTRPRVGTITSPAVTWTKDAFSPLDDAALKDWGL